MATTGVHRTFLKRGTIMFLEKKNDAWTQAINSAPLCSPPPMAATSLKVFLISLPGVPGTGSPSEG